MMESFFSSLEAEVLDRYRFRTRENARGEIFSWIEGGITHIDVCAILTCFSRIRGRLRCGEVREMNKSIQEEVVHRSR